MASEMLRGADRERRAESDEHGTCESWLGRGDLEPDPAPTAEIAKRRTNQGTPERGFYGICELAEPAGRAEQTQLLDDAAVQIEQLVLGKRERSTSTEGVPSADASRQYGAISSRGTRR